MVRPRGAAASRKGWSKLKSTDEWDIVPPYRMGAAGQTVWFVVRKLSIAPVRRVIVLTIV
jgi:hypothetical protein